MLGEGAAWILSQNASVNICVQFNLWQGDSAEGRPLGANYQTVDVWSKKSQRTAFANATLVPGFQSFVSLLVPVKVSDLSPTGLRSFQSTVSQSNEGVEATVSWDTSLCIGSEYCGTLLRLQVKHNGSWSVLRSLITTH